MRSMAIEEYMAILFHPCASALFKETRGAFSALNSYLLVRKFHNEVPRN